MTMTILKLARLFGLGAPEAEPAHGETRTQTITICDVGCKVTAHRTGKSSWKAYGYVQGTPIHAEDSTAPGAFSRWRVLAKAVPTSGEAIYRRRCPSSDMKDEPATVEK